MKKTNPGCKGRLVHSMLDPETGRFDWPPRERFYTEEQWERRAQAIRQGRWSLVRLGLAAWGWFK